LRASGKWAFRRSYTTDPSKSGRTCEPFPGTHDFRVVSTPFEARNTDADELLAIRCQLGERAAFDELIARWHEPLWRYLRRLANSDEVAGDLAQDTWVRVLRGMSALREPARLRPWLFGIARRVAMDRLRFEYTRRGAEDIELDALPGDDPAPELEADAAAIDKALAGLPMAEREMLTLFYLRELSLAEIAAKLSVPIGTVKSRLHRARNELRNAFSGDNT
jgi:RNA polymerase sigma factor (sigma-70 family)